MQLKSINQFWFKGLENLSDILSYSVAIIFIVNIDKKKAQYKNGYQIFEEYQTKIATIFKDINPKRWACN